MVWPLAASQEDSIFLLQPQETKNSAKFEVQLFPLQMLPNAKFIFLGGHQLG